MEEVVGKKGGLVCQMEEKKEVGRLGMENRFTTVVAEQRLACLHYTEDYPG